MEIWRIHFIALILRKRINLIPFEQSININFFVPQLQKCQRLRWGHLRCKFCPTIKKSEILFVKGVREEFWKWRRRLSYDWSDIYVLAFLLKVFPKKKWKLWKHGVLEWLPRQKSSIKIVVFKRNWWDVFISFWNWINSWLGIERVYVKALIRPKRINFLVFKKIFWAIFYTYFAIDSHPKV